MGGGRWEEGGGRNMKRRSEKRGPDRKREEREVRRGEEEGMRSRGNNARL